MAYGKDEFIVDCRKAMKTLDEISTKIYLYLNGEIAEE